MSETAIKKRRATVAIKDIDATARLRQPKAAAVDSLKISLQSIGHLLKPVALRKVRKGYRLIDGLHRLEAAKALGWGEVDANIFECTAQQGLQLEIEANITGAPMMPLDMAVFLAKHKSLYEAEHPETKRGVAGANARWHAADTGSVASFTRAWAEMLGKSDRHVRRWVAAGEKLTAEQTDQLQKAEQTLSMKDLDAIARCPDPVWLGNACQRFCFGEAKSIKVALAETSATPRPVPPSAAERKFQTLSDCFERAPEGVRQRFVTSHADALRALLDRHADAAVLPFKAHASGGKDV